MPYNALFEKVFGEEAAAKPSPIPQVLVLEFGDEYERLIRETIVDLVKNYKGRDCTERVAVLIRTLRRMIKNPGVRDKFSSQALGFVYNALPKDVAGATAELRQWLELAANPHDWREWQRAQRQRVSQHAVQA